MTKKHIYYVDAIVITPVKLRVVACNEQEAFSHAMDGAWFGCDSEPKTWDKARITKIGSIVKGPGIN